MEKGISQILLFSRLSILVMDPFALICLGKGSLGMPNSRDDNIRLQCTKKNPLILYIYISLIGLKSKFAIFRTSEL
jgi:hypothetical protein